MAYYRRRFRRKPYYRRRRYRRGRGGGITYGGIFKKVMKDVMHLKRLVNVEVKVVDETNTFTLANPTTAAVGDGCFNIAQGDGVSDRTGNSIKCLGGYAKRIFENPGAERMTVRCIMAIVWSTDAENPIYSEVVQLGTSILSPIKINNVRECKIIYDKVITLDPLRVSIVNMFDKFTMGHRMKYNGSTSAIGDTIGGQIFEWVFDDAITTHAIYTTTRRLRYVDN